MRNDINKPAETLLIKLRPWNESDLPLLFLLNTPEMTAYLGGPESDEKILARHKRYLEIGDAGKVFPIIKFPEQISVGSICYWSSHHNGEAIFEIGWAILPSYQGMGIATSAASLAIKESIKEKKHAYMHAFPSLQNVASNAICRKLGFQLISECDFEYPKGHFMKCNDWQLRLFA